jgi:hypothetical protein
LAAEQPLTIAADHLVRDDNSAQIRAVFDAINSYRASLGLGKVLYHPSVAGMAQEWSDSIASREVIEHRPSFWTDPRALAPDRGAGEVIAVRWDRNAAEMVAWWKSSAPHNAILTDPRLNVMGVGITFTDGNWQTTPTRYATWGVVDMFGYSTLPAGTVSSPGGTALPPAPTTPILGTLPHAASSCGPEIGTAPVPADLTRASIRSAGDIVALDGSGTLWNRASAGNGTLGTATAIMSGLSGVVRAYTPDWDGDGVFDVVLQWADGRVTLLPGRANGGFGAQVRLTLSEWNGHVTGDGQWCAGQAAPPVVAQDSAGGLYLAPDRGGRDMAQHSTVAGPPIVSAPPALSGEWRPLFTWRIVVGFVAGETGVVALRTDGSAVYAPFGVAGLGPGKELGTALNGLRLAG